jgi:hypothetical protein
MIGRSPRTRRHRAEDRRSHFQASGVGALG